MNGVVKINTRLGHDILQQSKIQTTRRKMTEAEAFFSSSFSADMAKDTAGCITAARKEENCSTVRDACYMKRRRGKGREADNKKVCVGVLVLHVNLIPVFAQTPGSSLFSSSIGKVSASMFSRERESSIGQLLTSVHYKLESIPKRTSTNSVGDENAPESLF